MNLSPRAIATQGLGFGPRLTAVQGLWSAQVASAAVRPRRAGDGISARRLREIDDEDSLLLALTLAAGMGVLQ
jgi:hypothetical protein